MTSEGFLRIFFFNLVPEKVIFVFFFGGKAGACEVWTQPVAIFFCFVEEVSLGKTKADSQRQLWTIEKFLMSREFLVPVVP